MPAKLSKLQLERSREAPFIFQGRVRKLGANNLKGIPPAPNHALVEVEEILQAPSNLGDLRKRVLTVVLKRPAKATTSGVWWATSWVFGDEIGVVELDRAEGARAATVRADVAGSRLSALDDLLVARIEGADLVVAGGVVSIEDLGLDGIAEGTTWRLAAVRVTHVVKGQAGDEAIVQFPGRGSPRWAMAPRLVLDQQGVFILRRPTREPRMKRVKTTGVWVALDPNDVHAPSALSRIEALVHAATALRSSPRNKRS
jgi:hypothetical protein